MKLKNLFFAGLALCTFAACSNEDEPKNEGGAPTSLAIEIASTSSKAYETTQSEEESEIKSILVQVLRQGTVVASATELTNVNGKPGVYFDINKGLTQNNTYDVRVIVNPAEGTTFDGTKVSVISEINAKTVSEKRFEMRGETKSVVLTNAAGSAANPGNSCIVNVKRYVARVDFASLTAKFEGANTANVASFTVKDVYVVNTPTDLTASAYLHGAAGILFSGLNVENSTLDANRYANPATKTIEKGGAALENLGQFYIFPNATGSKTTLVIKGTITFNNGTPAEDTFYTIKIGDEQNNNVAENTIYSVTANLNGISGGGDPTDLAVKVSVVDWTVVPIHKELN